MRCENMVRRFFVLVLLCGILSISVLFTASVQAAGDSVNNNFNTDTAGSVPVGWTAVTTGGTVSVENVPSAADKSVKIYKTGTVNQASATRTFTAISGDVAVEVKVKTMETTGFKCIPYILSPDGSVCAASIVFDNGNIKANVGGSWTTVQPFSVDTWYSMKTVVHTAANKFDLYINGYKMLDNAAVRSSVPSIGRVWFNMDAGNTGTVYFDDVRIYSQSVAADYFTSQTVGNVPSGWTANTAGGTVNIQNELFAGDQSVKIYKSAAANDASASKTFTAQTGKVVVEAKVKSMETTGFKCLPYIYASNGTSCVASIGFDSGNIKANIGGTWTVAQPFTADTWYTLRVVADTTAKKFDLYVDGNKKLSNVSFRETSAADVGKVVFSIGDGNAGTMYFDNVNVYELKAPVEPVYNVLAYGAAGNGATNDTAAIQAAIDAVPSSGGTVYLPSGTFISGTIRLKSNVTLYIDRTATLKAIEAPLESSYFPYQNPPTQNSQLYNCRRALIYAEGAANIRIDGGGTIDGNGGLPQYNVNSGGSEAKRPIMFFAVQCNYVTIQDVFFKDGAVWGIVPMECNYVNINHVSEYTKASPGNKDGIDIIDCRHVRISDCSLTSEDDCICPKSGVRSGIDDMVVTDCNVTSSCSGLKFGTAAYGDFKNVTFRDILVKSAGLSAIALESTDGSDIYNIKYERIDIGTCGTNIFMIIEDRGAKPANDARKIGSIDTVVFKDVHTDYVDSSIGSMSTGMLKDGTTYKIKNITFDNVDTVFKGAYNIAVPTPPEYTTGYPEYNVFGVLPAWGYYFRHIDGLTFTNCDTGVRYSDTRSKYIFDDCTNISGTP